MPRFGAIVRRRWPILIVLPILALGIALYNYKTAPKTYTATAEVTATSLAPLPAQPQGYDNYYRALASEAATDDFVRITQGSVFADNVTKRLQAKGSNESAQGAIAATRVYRVLTIKVTTSDPGRSVRIAQAALDELTSNGPSYLEGRPVALTAVSVPTGAAANALRSGVTAAGTLLAGVLLAIVIALATELIDTRVHDRQEVEDVLRLPVLGAIPRPRGAGRAA